MMFQNIINICFTYEIKINKKDSIFNLNWIDKSLLQNRRNLKSIVFRQHSKSVQASPWYLVRVEC
jgi:hypothetical protein